MLQDKYIVTRLSQSDGSYLEVTNDSNSLNTAVGGFHDLLEKMLSDNKYSGITCVLKDKNVTR